MLKTFNNKTKILILSGDVHYAEFLEDKCTHYIHGYNICEFVSSGLTHGKATFATYTSILMDEF